MNATLHKKAMHIVDLAMAYCESGENIGICLWCGAERLGVEPDAERYTCEECGKRAVYGAEQIVLLWGDMA